MGFQASRPALRRTRARPRPPGLSRVHRHHQTLSGCPCTSGCYKEASKEGTSSTAYLHLEVLGAPTEALSLEKVLTHLRRS